MYKRTVEGDVTRVLLEGDIDLYNADEFREALNDIDGKIVIDCNELNYIDSTGLGVLVAAFKNNARNVSITGLKPHLFRIFELTGLANVFDIEVAE